MQKPFVVISLFAGVLLLVIAAIYFIEPVKSLPSFFPGYDPHLVRHHYKHGILAFILAVFAFIFIWFESGKKSSSEKEQG